MASPIISSSKHGGRIIIYDDGDIQFADTSLNLYRAKGPAAAHANGFAVWYTFQHRLNRTDGPAVLHSNGDKEYWVDGIELPATEFFLKYGVL